MPGRLGVTPIPSAELVDDHAAVLLSWIRAGRRNAEVVHLGESCGLSLLPKDTEERLRAAIKAGATDALFAPGEQGGDRRGLSSSYLAAAARFGVLRRIYWVLPTRDLEHTNAELRIRYLIERTVPGISRAELDDLHLQKGCVRGRVSGIDLAVCSVETLPPIQGPVLMTIDSWFLPRYAREQGTAPLGGVRRLYLELARKSIPVADLTVVAAEREGDALRIRSRTMARQLLEGARDPGLLGEQPPYAWRVSDYVSSSLSNGNRAAARAALHDSRAASGGDGTVRFLRAAMLVMDGQAGDAGQELAELCRADGSWCPVFGEAASWLRMQGRPAEAEKLLRPWQAKPASGTAVTGAPGGPRS